MPVDRNRSDREDREAFEKEAERQSLIIAERSRDPSTESYALLKELEAQFDEPDTD